jgi:hypothetical protein
MRRPRAVRSSVWDEDRSEPDADPRASGTRKAARRLAPPTEPPLAAPVPATADERPTEPVAARQGLERVDEEPDAGPTYARVLTPHGMQRAEIEREERANRVTTPVPALAAAPCSVVDGITGEPSSSRPRPSLRELATFPRIPRRVRSASLTKTAHLDHTHAFVLTLIDGQIDVETICDVSPLPVEQVFRILDDLAHEGLIVVE